VRSATRAKATAATKEDRRQALVLAAFNQIAERGFEGLRTREVADEVGVNIATLHYYFPTKEALIKGVLAEAMRRFRATLEPHGSPADQLENHLRAVRKLMRDDPQLGLVMGELALRSPRDRSIADMMREVNEGWHRTLRGLLRRAAEGGHLDREFNNEGTAALIIATLTGATLPTVGNADRKDQAFKQLQALLNRSSK
jgi:AcrR family transcriptional regulator